MKIEQRLEELGVELPEPAVPVANYVTTVQTGNLVFTSGHGPGTGEGPIYKSQLGTDATIEEGYASARQVAICLLSTLKHALGDLEGIEVKRVVKVIGQSSSIRHPISPTSPRLSTAHRTFWLKCSVIKADMPAPQSAWCNCPAGFPLKLKWLLKLRTNRLREEGYNGSSNC